MIQVIIISSLAALLSIVIQVSPILKHKVILRRLYASAVLIIPCFFSFYGSPWSSYAAINSGDVRSTIMYYRDFLPFIVLVNIKAGKQSENTKMYPQIRTPRWTLLLFAMNGIELDHLFDGLRIFISRIRVHFAPPIHYG